MRSRSTDRKFETLEGLVELGLELSPKVFGRDYEHRPPTYVVNAQQLYVLANLADYAVKLHRADDYSEPERKASLHQDLRETLDRFWDTPLDTSVIRLHEEGY